MSTLTSPPGERPGDTSEPSKSDLQYMWAGVAGNTIKSPITRILATIVAVPIVVVYLIGLSIYRHWVEDGKKYTAEAERRKAARE